MDNGIIDQHYYETKAQQWNKEYEQARKSGKGGNFYATQATYLGEKFLDLAFGKYYQGRFNIEQLADYLNLKVQHISGLEPFVLKKVIA